jgi:ParB family chromosome partitioning protein
VRSPIHEENLAHSIYDRLLLAQLMQIPIEQIEHHPHRLNTDISSLESSLVNQGQLTPIRVRPHPVIQGKYEIIFGNRRFEAAKKLCWKTIEATVSTVSDGQAILMALSENIERDDFSDYEKGLLIDQFHRAENKSYAEIAKLLGKSLAYVYQHTAMLRLFPEEIASEEERIKVLSELNEKQARVLLKVQDPNERWATAKLVVSAKLCVREIEKLTSGTRRKKNGRQRNSKKSIEAEIKSIVNGLNTGDLRPHFEIMSENYSLFPSLPPYRKMNKDTAMQYMCGLVRSGKKFDMDDLEIKVLGKFAYASMQVPWDILYMGKRVRAMARATLVFVNDNGWKILHEHWSLANPLDVLEFIFSDKSVDTRSSLIKVTSRE